MQDHARSDAGHAVDVDRPLETFDETPDDWQAKAAEAGGVGGEERILGALCGIFIHPNTRIGNTDLD